MQEPLSNPPDNQVKIVLANNFEFNAESVVETRNMTDNVGILTIRVVIAELQAQPIWDNVTVQNMSHFDVYRNNVKVATYDQYTLITIDKIISSFDMSMNIRLQKDFTQPSEE